MQKPTVVEDKCHSSVCVKRPEAETVESGAVHRRGEATGKAAPQSGAVCAEMCGVTGGREVGGRQETVVGWGGVES